MGAPYYPRIRPTADFVSGLSGAGLLRAAARSAARLCDPAAAGVGWLWLAMAQAADLPLGRSRRRRSGRFAKPDVNRSRSHGLIKIATKWQETLRLRKCLPLFWIAGRESRWSTPADPFKENMHEEALHRARRCRDDRGFGYGGARCRLKPAGAWRRGCRRRYRRSCRRRDHRRCGGAVLLCSAAAAAVYYAPAPVYYGSALPLGEAALVGRLWLAGSPRPGLLIS